MKKLRIKLRGGLEYDLLTRWRHRLVYAGRPGICKFAKRQYNRRLRRNLREEDRHGIPHVD